MSPITLFPSSFSGVTSSTWSFRFTWISTLGFTSRDTVVSTA